MCRAAVCQARAAHLKLTFATRPGCGTCAATYCATGSRRALELVQRAVPGGPSPHCVSRQLAEADARGPWVNGLQLPATADGGPQDASGTYDDHQLLAKDGCARTSASRTLAPEVSTVVSVRAHGTGVQQDPLWKPSAWARPVLALARAHGVGAQGMPGWPLSVHVAQC